MKYIQLFEIPILYFFLSFLLESIDDTGAFGETPNAFIFSLNNNEGLAPFMSKVKETFEYGAIYRYSGYGPTFGNDLVIKAQISQSTESLGSYYSVPSSVRDRATILMGPGPHFSPDKVEVFYLDPSR